MPAAASRSRRAPVVVLALALPLAVALLLGPGAGAAAAHDVLVGSTPVADSAQATAPDQVVLEFGDGPQPLGLEVAVTDPAGTPVSVGMPEVDGATVVQPLAGDLPAGSYTVDWRVTSADGHPLSGTFAFTVTSGAPASSDGAASSGADPGAAAPADGDRLAPASEGSSSPVLWLAVAAVVVAAGALVVRQVRRPA